jgi:hypothetical protein
MDLTEMYGLFNPQKQVAHPSQQSMELFPK